MDELHASEQDTQPNEQATMTREQKMGFFLLLLFGLITVGLGFLQVRNTIYSPFVVRIDKDRKELSDLLKDESTRLQQIDTDRDGISDYDELYFYETSPYLPDTDSDGTSDKEEIDAGQNPLCPSGEECDTGETADQVPADLEELTPQGLPSEEVGSIVDGALQGAGEQGVGDIEGLINNPDALRFLLKNVGGLTDEQIAEFDDATIIRMAQEVFAEKAFENAAPEETINLPE